MENMTKEQLEILNKDEVFCGDFMLLIGDFHDQELSDDLHEKLDNHRLGCSCCYDVFESYEDTINIVKQYGKVEIPADTQDRLMKFVNELHAQNLR